MYVYVQIDRESGRGVLSPQKRPDQFLKPT